MITDTYYRGYRFSEDITTARVSIWYGSEFICSAESLSEAREIVDTWQNPK